METILGWMLSQLPGVIVGLLIGWNLPMPAFVGTFWAWAWAKVTGKTTETETPALPTANTV